MRIYTIGFAQKRAETFFGLLLGNNIQWVADIRLNPGGQLAGFTKQEDLAYFLRRLVAGCRYVHIPLLAPTKEILSDYRADGDWARYQARFETLMDERRIPEVLNRADFEEATACLLCSEPTPDYCHRRLIAERLAAHWPNVEVVHL